MKQNIEDLYKNFCETYTEHPPHDMWDRIEVSLNKKEENGRIVWMRFAAVAASLTMLISLSVWIWLSSVPKKYENFLSDVIENQEVQTDDNQSDNNEIDNTDDEKSSDKLLTSKSEQSLLAAHIYEKSDKIIEKSEYKHDDLMLTKQIETDNNIETDNSNEDTLSEDKFSDHNNVITVPKNDIPLLTQQQTNYFDALFIDPHPDNANNNKKKAQIELGGAYSPIYSYRQASDRNNDMLITADYPNETGIINSGGGVSLSVRFSEKWSVESGVNYAKMGHKIDNPEINNRPFANDNNVFVLNHVYLNNTMGTANIDNSFISNPDNTSDIPTPPNVVPVIDDMPLKGSIEQNLEYLEVPFTFRYYITDAKFSVSMSAGISANFLVNNSFYLKHDNLKEKIGTTAGISNLTMSTHAGISFATPVFKQLLFQIEPRVNYFLEEINKNHIYKYRPYSFGIYSGVRYQFGK